MAGRSSVHEGDMRVNGHFTSATMALPASSVSDAQIAPGAGIAVSKLEHRHVKTYAQPNTSATTVTIPIHVAEHAGEVFRVSAGSIAAAIGAATVTVDLRKNGTTVLTGVITLDSANAARIVEPGTLASDDYVAGDFFEFVIVATAGGGTLPTGLIVQVVFDEES